MLAIASQTLVSNTVVLSAVDNYNTYAHVFISVERFEFNLNRVYAAVAFIILAGLFCVLLIVATFLNSYQTVSTWWKGPPIMYLLSFLIGACNAKLLQHCTYIMLYNYNYTSMM